MHTQPKHIDCTPTVDRWRGIAIVLALIAAVAAPLWHLHVIDRTMPATYSDLLLVRTGVRAILSGIDPYSEHTTREIQIAYYGRTIIPNDQAKKMAFVYPAHTAVVLAPFALLSWDRARLAFLVVVPVLMAMSVPLWLLILNVRASHFHTTITIILVLSSWPMMWGLRLQQPTLIVAFFLVGGCFLLQRQGDVSAGFLFALSTIKPQLVGPLLLWLLLWAVLQRRRLFLVSFFASALLLLLCSLRMLPDWLSNWRSSMADYARVANVHTALQIEFGRWIGTTLGVAMAAVVALILWRLRRCDINSREFGIAISLALAATISLNPMFLAMIYNDVLLLPAFLILIYAKPTKYYPAVARRISLTMLGLNFAVTLFAALGESIWRPSILWCNLPFQNILLPLPVLAVITLALITGLRPASQTHKLDGPLRFEPLGSIPH